MNFALVASILLGIATIQSVETRTSCGSVLVNHLEFICGAKGMRQSWRSRLENKYPNLKGTKFLFLAPCCKYHCTYV